MNWYNHMDDPNLEDWLRESMPSKCEYCGAQIENGYNEKSQCTRRRCTNSKCIGTEAAKAAFILTDLKVKGIKEKTAYKLMVENGISRCYEIIPVLFKEKPMVTLPQLFKYAFIFGLDTELVSICGESDSVAEVFENYKGDKLPKLEEVKQDLIFAENFFSFRKRLKSVKEYPTVLSGCVVITGEVPGMEGEREKLVPYVNHEYMGFVNFTYAANKRKTGLYCCISQDKHSHTGKATEARSAGAPVYTVAEFFQSINQAIVNAGYGEELRQLLSKEGG